MTINNIFEKIKKMNEHGQEFWSARDLWKILGYTEYGKFLPAINRAKKACENSKQEVLDHFAEVSDMVKIGSGAERKIDDYNLSRYACYLIVQNGDPKKEAIALAQTYFAIQTMGQNIAIFEDFKIRKHFNKKTETWYFSIIDIIAALTEQSDYKKAKTYWTTLKSRLKKEGSEVVTNCDHLKMKAQDGKMRLTDVADVETILRLVQSVPSKKAEPIKLWLAKAGYERMQEIVDPVQSINRARENWQKAGRSDKWIGQRMMGQETRNKLTDYWAENDIKKGQEFAILTNIIHSEWSGLSVKEHKNLKNLKSQNLRDHMSEAELIFTALAELSTRQIAETEKAKGMNENKKASKKGGNIAKKARLELEEKTGKKVVNDENYLRLKKADRKSLESKNKKK